MFKLPEDKEDAFLSKEEQLEETIGSIDYDVWVTADKSDMEIIAYHSKLSRYVGCPKCSTKAFHKVSSKVIRSPTYSSPGRGEELYKCENCGHRKTKTYSIARKRRSSSGGYYGGSGMSGGGFSGGGGGFSGGGGSSGGGGASGGW